jgi:hypothetical protein
VRGCLRRCHRRKGTARTARTFATRSFRQRFIPGTTSRRWGRRRRRIGTLDGWADSRRRHVVAPLQRLKIRSATRSLLDAGSRWGRPLRLGEPRFGRGYPACALAARANPTATVGSVRRERSPARTRAREASAGPGQGRGTQRDRAGRTCRGCRSRRRSRCYVGWRHRSGHLRCRSWQPGTRRRGGDGPNDDRAGGGNGRPGGGNLSRSRSRLGRLRNRRRSGCSGGSGPRPDRAGDGWAARGWGRRGRGRWSRDARDGPRRRLAGRRRLSPCRRPRAFRGVFPPGLFARRWLFHQLSDSLHGRRVETGQGADLDIKPPLPDAVEQLRALQSQLFRQLVNTRGQRQLLPELAPDSRGCHDLRHVLSNESFVPAGPTCSSSSAHYRWFVGHWISRETKNQAVCGDPFP